MNTNTQAIRERAERLIKLARKTNHGHPLAQQNFDDACFLEVPTVCRDLLAALDREKVLEGENANFRTWGIIEVAIRNPNVMDYMKHWEGRAEAAEAQLATLRQQVQGGVLAVRSLIDDSYGVTGLHQNGDVAPWAELQTGGRFEEWLADFNVLESAFPKPAQSEGE